MERRASVASDFLYSPNPVDRRNPRRPLIEQCTNAWRTDPRYRESVAADPTPDWIDILQSTLERTWAIFKAPKAQRLVAAFIFAFIVAVVCWKSFLSVTVSQHKAVWDSMNSKTGANRDNVFGTNKRVHLPDIRQVAHLDPKYLPRISKTNPERADRHKRLVFIGDIHGCMDELQALLAEAKYKPENDHIIATGDMINKGPKTKEVVDFLMKQGASCVRGNHEDRILLMAKMAGNTHLTTIGHNAETQNTIEESKAARKSRDERQLAASLSREELEWLSSCPLILRVGKLGKFGEIVVVHGGLVPGIDLESQDPMSVMNMRIINITTHMPSNKHSEEGSVPWYGFWNKWQRLLSAQQTLFGLNKSRSNFMHTTVVYGHDSRRGLQLHTYTKGLDSGCVNGKKLSAWILGDLGHEELVQVSCGEITP